MTIKNTNTKPKKKKRRRRFGNVTRRPSGPGYLARFTDPSGRRLPSGRKSTVTKSVQSRAEGEEFLRQVERAVIAGRYFGAPVETEGREPCPLTVDEAVTEYIAARRGAGITQTTAAIYEYSAKPIRRNGLGRKLARDLTTRDVEGYLGWRSRHQWQTRRKPGGKAEAVLIKGGPSASTVARDRELLCATLTRLVKLGELSANVVSLVPKPKKPQRSRPVLSKPEIQRLVDGCDEFLRPFVLAGLFTGARKSELLCMVWGDVNFDNMTIAVTRSKTSNFSLLPLAPPLERELREVKKRRIKSRISVADDEPIFLSRFGTVYRSIRGGWNAAIARAGLDKRRGVTPHILRHCFAVHYLGVPGAAVTDLQAALGHSSLKTTAIYAQMADERMRESVNGLDYGLGRSPLEWSQLNERGSVNCSRFTTRTPI